MCLPRGLRGVAVLALLRSSHSHICLGNGYSVVEVHGGSLEAPLTFPLPNFFRIFPLLFKIFSFELVNYKKPSLCRAFSKFPSLGRQREGQKINPLEKFFCFGSKLEPFFVYGIKIDAIKISACLFSEADAHFSYSFLPQQPDQQLIDILGGLAACYQLVPKGQQGLYQQPSFAGAEC